MKKTLQTAHWGNKWQSAKKEKTEISQGGSFFILFFLLFASHFTLWAWEQNSTYAASCGNVPVQGPEICFPKHASCDFTQHCLSQHPAYWFLEISCEKRTNPEPLPLSHLALFRQIFFFFFFLPPLRLFFFFFFLTRSDYVALQSARSMTKDF